MSKLILVMVMGIVLSGCSITPTYDKGTLVWVGCHRVEQNPSPEGSRATLLLYNLDKGDKMYLQQIDHNGNANVTVGEPCK
jgi:hypothetical protein|tara:strand:+ start:238 stop:480 length:243 start_codon:yes stop_codon:yes gene_type:complete